MNREAYMLGVRAAMTELGLEKSADANSATIAAVLGGLGGGYAGHALGSNYGFWLAGDSPHYRDVERKKLLWGALGLGGGALAGAGIGAATSAIIDAMRRV